MVLYPTEVRVTLKAGDPQELRLRGYSHPGLEKVYSEAERDSREVVETGGDALRQVKDFKVRIT